MSVTQTTSIKFACDFESCGVPELVEGTEPQRAGTPDGWFELTVPHASKRLVFNSEDCLLRFVRSLSVSRRDGNAEMVGSVNSYLDGTAL